MNMLFSARVLQCMRFRCECTSLVPARTVMDYEFDFCVGCDREMWIDGKQYHIEKGSFIVRRPGQRGQARGVYDCYMLTLDFSGHSRADGYSRNTATEMQPVFDSPIWEILPTVFKPAHYDDYLRIFEELVSISEWDINDNERVLPRINELLHLLIADAVAHAVPASSAPRSPVEEACAYIKNHYAQDISVDTLAQIVHLNKSYLARQFKKEFGMSPIAYLIKVRMDYAKKLLTESALPVKEVAVLCGYSDPSFFNFYFKKSFHISPAAYRRARQESTMVLEQAEEVRK